MAVSRRIRLGGLVRILSPIEGKYRVKGGRVLALACEAISELVRAGDQSRQAFSALEIPSSTFAAFFTAFSLGRMVVITDNAHL